MRLKLNRKKRNILSIISTIYDPVGYFQPITIRLKILFQEICKLDISCYDAVKEILLKWKSICEFLNSLHAVIVDKRYYIYSVDGPRECYFLHGFSDYLQGFSDSSLVAYEACIYLKSVSRNGNIYVVGRIHKSG